MIKTCYGCGEKMSAWIIPPTFIVQYIVIRNKLRSINSTSSCGSLKEHRTPRPEVPGDFHDVLLDDLFGFENIVVVEDLHYSSFTTTRSVNPWTTNNQPR